MRVIAILLRNEIITCPCLCTKGTVYKRAANQRQVHEIVCERPLKFTGHCLQLPGRRASKIVNVVREQN